MIFWRAGTSEKGTDRDGEADQRGWRDLQDQETEQKCRGDRHRRPRRDGGGEAADVDARFRASTLERTSGTRGTAGQEDGYR